MDLKTRARKLKTDIPPLLLALNDSDTPFLAKVFEENRCIMRTLKKVLISGLVLNVQKNTNN